MDLVYLLIIMLKAYTISTLPIPNFVGKPLLLPKDDNAALDEIILLNRNARANSLHGTDTKDHPLSRQRRLAVDNDYWLWPNGVVPYIITGTYDEAQLNTISEGMGLVEASGSCIKFVKYNDTESLQAGDIDTYINIINDPNDKGCWSYIGRGWGEQKLSLYHQSKWYTCVTRGIVQHELVHALGGYHEHVRADRDMHVKINWKNIPQGVISEFSKEDVGVSYYKTEYNTASLMHYGAYAYSNYADGNGKTIESLDGSNSLGGQVFTEKDKTMLINLYSSVCPKAAFISTSQDETTPMTTTETPMTTAKTPLTTTTTLMTTTTTLMTTTTTSKTTTTTPMTTTTTPMTTTETPMTTTTTPKTNSPDPECIDLQNCDWVNRLNECVYSWYVKNCKKTCKLC